MSYQGTETCRFALEVRNEVKQPETQFLLSHEKPKQNSKEKMSYQGTEACRFAFEVRNEVNKTRNIVLIKSLKAKAKKQGTNFLSRHRNLPLCF